MNIRVKVVTRAGALVEKATFNYKTLEDFGRAYGKLVEKHPGCEIKEDIASYKVQQKRKVGVI